MSNQELDRQFDNVRHMLSGLFWWLAILLSGLTFYLKVFSIWSALAMMAPAIPIVLFGQRSLQKLQIIVKKDTA